MKKLIILGQSTAYGLDIVKPSSVQMGKDDYRNSKCFWHYTYEKQGFDSYLNLAAPGDSNDAIIRKVLETLAANKEDDLYFLVCVSAGELFEVFDKNSNTLKNVIFTESSAIAQNMEGDGESIFSKRAPNEIKELVKLYSKNFLNVDHSLSKFFTTIISLQSIFKQRNVPYQFVHSISPALSTPYEVLREHPIAKMFDSFIDKTKFVDYLEKDVMTETVKNSAKVGRFFHALEDGHEVYGRYLAEKISF